MKNNTPNINCFEPSNFYRNFRFFRRPRIIGQNKLLASSVENQPMLHTIYTPTGNVEYFIAEVVIKLQIINNNNDEKKNKHINFIA